MKKELCLGAVSAALLFGSANAQLIPGSITADVGYTFFNLNVEGDGRSFDLDDEIDGFFSADLSVGAITARAAYAFTPYVSVEGEAGFGINDEESNGPGFRSSFGIGYLIGGYGKFTYPVSPLFNVYGRIGIAGIEVESESEVRNFGVTVREEDSSTESAFAFGGGATYTFSPVYYGRADYTRYELDDDGTSFDLDVNAFTIAAGRYF